MSNMPKFVTKKKVTVYCNTPFRIGKIPYSGVCRNITLTIQDIAACIEKHAKVVEVLANGKEIPLDFSNYDTYNGPTEIDDNSEVLSNKPNDPVIEQKNQKGETIDIINEKKEEKKEEKKVVKVITNVEPKEEVEVKTDTKSSVEVTSETEADTNTKVEATTENEADTKVEVEANEASVNTSNNNKQYSNNYKKNKYK